MKAHFIAPKLKRFSARTTAEWLRTRFTGSIALYLAFLSLSLVGCVAPAGLSTANIDFSNYDVPLYDQITNRIKMRVVARLGHQGSPRDRYFIVPFAYQNRLNTPEGSHSFMSVIRVFASGKKTQVTEGLGLRTYKHWNFEAFTISWLPADFDKNPHLCVFDGFGARLISAANKCTLSPGKSFPLDKTIQFAVEDKSAVCMWGPYEITKAGFDLAVERIRLLNTGVIKYRADDRRYRRNRIAINCFHAMAGLEELYPNGGIFGTGFKMWGINGTSRVLIEYKDRGKKMGLLLQPVNEKADRYGFVYAPSRSTSGIYSPFRKAAAYHQ